MSKTYTQVCRNKCRTRNVSHKIMFAKRPEKKENK